MFRIGSYKRVLSYGVPFGAFSRDIWLICLSNVIGAFGEGLYFWIFPIYIRELHADYVQLGLVLAVLYGASALALLPGGLLADRFDRKKILIAAWAPWAFSPLIYSFASHWMQLIPGTICWGISMIGVPAANAYIITSVTDKKRLASVMSFVWACYSVSYIIAPTVGVWLTDIIGMEWVLRVSALLTGIATGIFLLLHSQRPPKKNINQQSSGERSIEERRLLRRLLIWSAFFAVITFFMTVGRSYVQIFLNENVKLGEFYVGLFGSFNFAGLTLLGIGMGRLGDKWRKGRVISLCVALYAVSMLPIVLVNEPSLLMLAAFVYGGSSVIGFIVASFVGGIAPERKRGLWSSVPQTLSLAAAFVAPYVGGYLYTFSPYYAFAVSVGAAPLLAVLALMLLKE